MVQYNVASPKVMVYFLLGQCFSSVGHGKVMQGSLTVAINTLAVTVNRGS